MTAEQVLSYALSWAKDFDGELYDLLSRDTEYAKAIFSVDRDTPKPRKDIAKFSEIRSYVEYYFDELYKNDFSEMPENITADMAREFLSAYIESYNPADSKDEWFLRIKDLCEPLGYTPNVKEYKKNPELYKGHVGDVSTVIRIAVTGRRNTPDLYSIMQILGEEKVKDRMKTALAFYQS